MKTDAISLYAKPSAGFATKLAVTRQQLKSAREDHVKVVQANSLGAEDMVLAHLIHELKLPIEGFVLDTGKLHAETLALVDAMQARYRIAPKLLQPAVESVIHFVTRHGERAMYQSVELRKTCCAIRKLEPLERALKGADAWITGLRREQSDARAEVPFVEHTPGKPAKYNPLADWTQGDVWHFIASHQVPYNALHDQLYPSIGCVPCTRAITLGEDIRSGRWWWEQVSAKECGLHVSPELSRP
jgi:phosphoadenosine phosphosulfate reductase